MRSEEERTFLRPDHLRQHVKNFHKATLKDAVRDAWRKEGPGKDVVEKWVCGFCTQELKTWDIRETHIAGHFKDGLTMADWRDYTQPNIAIEASKKRPTSSEGRPNVFAKLARTLTSQSTHQQQPNSQFANDFEPIPISTALPVSETPLLPDIVFDSFMAEVCGNTFDCTDPNSASLNDQPPALDDRHDSVLPEDPNMDFDFSTLAGVFLDEDISRLSGLWYQ
jgi:hypothetical protein